MYFRWEPKIVFGERLMFYVMVELLLKQFMSYYGTIIALLLLISMVYAGGLLFRERNIVLFAQKSAITSDLQRI